MKTVRIIGSSSQEYEDDLTNSKKDFIIKMSGYTTIIEHGEWRWLFSDDFIEGNFEFVDAADLIKADIDTIAPEIDVIPEIDLVYFDINSNLGDKLNLRRAYNVDIRNCYLTTAINFGFISQQTFDFCNTLKSKHDKHKAFGMLATSYACFEIKSGEVIRSYQEVNERHRKYFFAVVSEISAVMQKIKSELYNDYIFYWVDGIYFKTKAAAERAREILKENQFDSSFDMLDNFTMFLDDDLRYIIRFGKKGESKIFTVPKIKRNPYAAKRIRELIKLAEINQTVELYGEKQTAQTAQTITQ